MAQISRQNTLSSQNDARSMRQSKRQSVTALYISMSAKERDLEIDDDLAKGMILYSYRPLMPLLTAIRSSKNPARLEDENILAIEKELRAGKGCPIS